MAQFVTHIQPTMLEASQGHIPHHHQVGVQHSSHLPHSGHNLPSQPTLHNHHHHHHHGNSSQQQQQHQKQQHQQQQHQQHQQQQQHSHHKQQQTHHGHANAKSHHSPPSQISSPPGEQQHEHIGHYDYYLHQHEQVFHHPTLEGHAGGHGAAPISNNKHHHHDKHEHCPTGHQSALNDIQLSSA
ncbi:myb-like protein Q [Drosophila tropicalis]|uniref:myb-like protein Q n=1 Tax=Drosophila tropicalis TaxID=46794 RepID=UPI0035ABD1DD